MGIGKRFKDWCPQPPNRLPTRIRSYSVPIAIALAAALIFGMSYSLIASQSAMSQSLPQPPIVGATPESSDQINTPLPTPNPQENSTLISKEKAINISMPIIEKYCQDNNRVIVSINASLAIMADYTGTRGGPTFPEVMEKNLPPAEAHSQYNYYPVWSVIASFESLPSSSYGNLQYWIDGMTVIIWADTGQVSSSNPNGHY